MALTTSSPSMVAAEDLDRLLGGIESTFEAIYQAQMQRQPFHDEVLPVASPLGQPPTSGAPMLPTRLPLKRRLAEFRHTMQHKADGIDKSRFTVGTLAIERFRDISPSFVMAIWEDAFVLEPGDIGPIPFGHPIAEELIWAVNNQRLTAGLMPILLESGCQFYDGCLVVGLVDYRKQAFGVANMAQNGPSAPAVPGPRYSSSAGIVKNPAVQPEMHKILLRPTQQTLTYQVGREGLPEDLALEAEAKLLLATSGPVCLDPSPAVAGILRTLHYDRDKMKAGLGPLCQPPRSVVAQMGPGGAKAAKGYSLINVIEAQRNGRKASDAEPFYGLDVKKDPMRFKESTLCVMGLHD